MKSKYLTVTEVAEMLKVSYDTALNFVKTKTKYTVIGRQYRVLENRLNEALYPSKSVKQKLSKRPVYTIEERV